MKPAYYYFEIQQGTDFELGFTWATRDGDVDTPVDITGCNAKFQILADDGTTIEWSTSESSPHITLDVLESKFILTIPSAETKLLNFNKGEFEFEVTTAVSKIYRFIKGSVKLIKEIQA